MNKEKFYPLTENQKGLLFLSQIDEAKAAYNLPAALMIRGDLDLEKLEEAVRLIIARHDSLRTAFRFDGMEPIQVVHDAVYFRLKKIDLSAFPEEEKNERVKMITAEAKEAFDLELPPLLRVTVVKLKESEYMLLITMHHIISDGWSLEIFKDELIKVYGSLVSGEEIMLEKPLQFGQVISWLEGWMGTEKSKIQLDYWLNKLSGMEPLSLPKDFPGDKKRSFRGKRLNFSFGEELCTELKNFARREKSTLFITLLAAFYLLLYRFTGKTDLVITSPFAGRLQEGWEKIIGFLANNMLLRAQIVPESTFRDFLAEVKKSTFEAYRHQPFPYSKIVRELNVRTETGSITDVSFGFDLISAESIEDFYGLHVEGFDIEEFDIPSELMMFLMESPKGIIGYMDYAVGSFKEETIREIIKRYEMILKKIVQTPDCPIKNLDLISDQEKEDMLALIGRPYLQDETGQTYVQLFEEQVHNSPDKIAVVFKEQALTYRQLDKGANYIAGLLQEKGVRPGVIVGVMTERSPEMLMSIIGVLKAGGAYLPLDPELPAERIKYMLEDSSANLLLRTEDHYAHPEFAGEIILVKKAEKDEGFSFEPTVPPGADDLMYVIYTSGSTGKPKGVMISHRSFTNFIKGITEQIDFSPSKTIVSVTTMSFDIFLLETLLPLSRGMKVVLAEKEHPKRVEELLNLIIDRKVTMLQTTPSGMQLILMAANVGAGLEKLTEIMIGGEPFPLYLLDEIKKYTQAKIYNMYGPTEATVWATVRELTNLDYIDIGKPIANVQVLVLDPNNRIQPPGFIGEICIAGAGLAKGYLKRPELTRERFIANPYGNGIIYRTGDLGRWKHDGHLECLGRIDEQVKIRGYRIELGEIENKLISHPEIENAAVTVREDKAKRQYLAAYLVSRREISVSELRQYLASELPDYMIPSCFVRIAEMPLSPNGKTDKRALPEPPEIHQNEYVPPRNEREKKLVAIWQDVLDLDQVGIKDNFFESGGDSIKAIQFLARLQQMGLRIDLADLFKFPTIEELSSRVKIGSKKPFQGIVEGAFPLNPSQESLIEMQALSADTIWYNTLTIYNAQGFTPEKVEQVLLKMLEHHDALRISLDQTEQGLKLINHGMKYKVVLQTRKEPCFAKRFLCGLNEEINKLISLIDYTEGPLLRASLLQTGNGDYLIMPVHRLIADEYSLKILAEDFITAYKQVSSGQEITFGEKTHSLMEWTNRLAAYGECYNLSKEKDYWFNNFRCQAANGRGGNHSTNAKRKKITFVLSEKATKELLTVANWAYNTQPLDLILTAIVLAVSKEKNDGNVLVFLENHDRQKLMPEIDLSRTVGKISYGFPLSISLDENKEMSYQIKWVKESLRRVPNRGIGYGFLRYCVDDEATASKLRSIVPDLFLNYLGELSEEINTKNMKASILRADSIAARSFPLELCVGVQEGMMSFDFICLDQQKAKAVKDMAMRVKENLNRIITYCVEQTEQEFTPSDYGWPQLSLDELTLIEEHVKRMET